MPRCAPTSRATASPATSRARSRRASAGASIASSPTSGVSSGSIRSTGSMATTPAAAVTRPRTASATRSRSRSASTTTASSGPGRTGPRNQRRAPMAINAAFYPTLMWNSRFIARVRRSVRQQSRLRVSRTGRNHAVRICRTCSPRRRSSRRRSASKPRGSTSPAATTTSAARCCDGSTRAPTTARSSRGCFPKSRPADRSRTTTSRARSPSSSSRSCSPTPRSIVMHAACGTR